MKRSLFYIFLLLTGVTWLAGSCSHPSQSDPRLLTVDRLVGENPDNALVQLKAIDPEQFGSDADRAYYALLLTQAKYKCYIPATSDSVINIALDYYTHHKGDRERLTRALIYKGAVMEELGRPEEAIVYYKDAQNTVADDDAFNQGYIRLRLGNIYRDQMVADSTDIMMFKEALRYFKQVPDSFYILTCLTEIGSSYTKTNPDSMLPYFYQADELARKLNEKSLKQINDIYIAEQQMFSPDPRDVDAAKQIALSQLNDEQGPTDYQEEVRMIAAYTLAKQHKPDSASLYLNQVSIDALATPNDTVHYYLCLAEIAAARGDIKQYKHYDDKADAMADSLIASKRQMQLRDIEAKYDNEVLKNENLRSRTIIASLIAAALALASILSIALLMLRRRRLQLKEREDAMEQLCIDQARLTSQLKNNQTMNESLKETIHHQITTFCNLVEEHHRLYTTEPEAFNQLFMKSYNAKKPDGSFWASIRAYADSMSNGFVSHAVNECPELTDSDVRFLSLYVSELPISAIMICLGYNNLRTTYNKKRRIAEMLNQSDSLDQYIANWKQGHQNMA